MLATLELIKIALKYCALVTLVRLASTAFNWEFGVSRQYLRLLETVFDWGEQRIKKVQSAYRLHLDALQQQQQHQQQQEQHYEHSSSSSGSSVANLPDAVDGLRKSQSQPGEDGQCVAAAALTHSASLAQVGAARAKPQQPSRRISSPNGPPVFLLDADDFLDELSTATTAHVGDVLPSEHTKSLIPIEEDEQPQTMCGASNGSGGGGGGKHEFHLDDACCFLMRGISAIVDDQVTKRFTKEDLKTWNLLTRTNARNYQFMSTVLGLYWFVGFLVRYAALLPLRIMFTLAGFVWLVCSMTLVGCLPQKWRARPYRVASLMSMRMLSCGITSRLRFHNRQYRAKNGDICVANHTSPIDVVLLACDNCYALVGQRHRGLLGILERALSRAANHVWFDRAEMRDRQLVTQRLREHVHQVPSNLPVLIFPEGTCINNSAVMLFRKGAFETTDRVCPVAIKYDSRFGDPFWNSSKQSYTQYLLLMMSSWAIKCDVWYMPPMHRLPAESSAEFAARVKSEIARQGGLDDLNWDGQLKRKAPKMQWLHQQQEDYARRLKID